MWCRQIGNFQFSSQRAVRDGKLMWAFKIIAPLKVKAAPCLKGKKRKTLHRKFVFFLLWIASPMIHSSDKNKNVFNAFNINDFRKQSIACFGLSGKALGSRLCWSPLRRNIGKEESADDEKIYGRLKAWLRALAVYERVIQIHKYTQPENLMRIYFVPSRKVIKTFISPSSPKKIK